MTCKQSFNFEAGSRKQTNDPRLISDIWSERLANGNDAFALACRQHLINVRKEVAAL